MHAHATARRFAASLPNLCRIAAVGSTNAASVEFGGRGLWLTIFSLRCVCLFVCSLAAEAGLIRDLNSFGKEHKFKREA